ncbi:MAG TPA: hypothetical protein VGH20_04540 [Myxococcales bacterium]
MIALLLTTLVLAAPASPPLAAAKKANKQQPVEAAPAPEEDVEPASQVPPAVLPDRPSYKTGLVVFMENPDPEMEHKLGEVVRNALLTNKKLRDVRIIKGPPLTSCRRDCFARIGIENKLDVLVMVTRGDNSVGLSVFYVPARREVSEESHATPRVLAQNLAVAEQLTCDYMVPQGCTGKVSIIAPPDVRISLDGTDLDDPLHVTAKVGVRHLFATSPRGGASRPYTIYVLREENPPTYVFRMGSLLVFSDTPPPQDAGPANAVGRGLDAGH